MALDLQTWKYIIPIVLPIGTNAPSAVPITKFLQAAVALFEMPKNEFKSTMDVRRMILK